ncbi:MAG: hypothetical protein EON87_05405 [Brevundimonas sp.]|nr:MAG: hypothetical protein EON87_05405 [Brevundimonas sp.]
MITRTVAALAAGFALTAAVPALAQDAPAAPPAPRQGSMLDKAVNTVQVSAWNVYGANQTHEIVTSTVQGGRALRVNITAAGGNTWDVGAGSTSTKPVKAGDVLLLAVWMRAERAPEGRETGTAVIRLQGAADPYPDVVSVPVAPTGEWKLYFANAVADRDWAPGALGATVQLAGASQTIDLGPVFIFDMGPDYDRSTLPTN